MGTEFKIEDEKLLHLTRKIFIKVDQIFVDSVAFDVPHLIKEFIKTIDKA